VIVDDGMHNAFTDITIWRGSLWLVYVASPSHFASPRSRLVILNSTNTREWYVMASLNGGGEDIRDPKLAVIHNRLSLFALLNQKYDPQPYKTVYANSSDGKNWSSFVDIGPGGWLLGKPKTTDQMTWFAPAHNFQTGTVVLMRSGDGLQWDPVSTICASEKADETAIEFLSDGQMLSATRLEAGGGLFGSCNGGTWLASSPHPYEDWAKMTRSPITRLDGPALFRVGDDCFAIGRFQPQVHGPFCWQGSVFSRKRTAIFLVGREGLTWLKDLPSTGDTAYAGVEFWDGQIVISYYTNDPKHDYPWILGMFRPTRIQVTRVSPSDFSINSNA
jgi:hypothetical protein